VALVVVDSERVVAGARVAGSTPPLRAGATAGSMVGALAFIPSGGSTMVLRKWMRMCAAAGILPAAACSSTSSSTSGVVCMNPSSDETACDSCGHGMCPSEYGGVLSACYALSSCETSCQCSDTSCTSACTNKNLTSGCQSALGSLLTCQEANCAAACNGSASGSSSSSGAGGNSSGGGTGGD
jgi:hypothetical protein